ncbi:MAG: transaldolase family protein [Bacillota bacterium]|nr:transaldolase family protein [Bacillota bacterium]
MNANSYFHRVHDQTPTRFWINNVTEEEARLAIEAGAVGCTQNPSYVWKMMQASPEAVFSLLDDILDAYPDDNEALIELQKQLIERIAAIFLPIWEKTHGRSGHVTIQGDPFDERAANIVRQGVANCRNYPNLSAKVPVTEEGLKAIPELAAQGITLTMTEVMSVQQAMDACDAWGKATADLAVRPVAYLAHIPGIFDEYLQHYVADNKIDIEPDILWQAGVAVSKKVHDLMRQRLTPVHFMAGGARGLHHFTEIVGAQGFVTINWKGTADDLIKQDPPVVQRFLQPTPPAVLDRLMLQLDEFRRAYWLKGLEPADYEHYGPVVLFRTSFEKAWRQALEAVTDRRRNR